eukprot:157864_1
MRKTYGVEINRWKQLLDLTQFPAGFAEKYSLYNNENGREYITNCFGVLVRKGQAVKVGDKPIRQSYRKAWKAVSYMTINVFSSTIVDPLTTVEDTTTKLGTIAIPEIEGKCEFIVEFSFSN